MTVYHIFKVRKRTINNIDIIMKHILWSWCVFGNSWPSHLKNLLPIFVETLRLYGGLNHIVFLFLFLVLLVTADTSFCCWNVVLCLNSLSANALRYKYLDLLNIFSSADKLLILLDILLVKLLIIFGRWLDRMFI